MRTRLALPALTLVLSAACAAGGAPDPSPPPPPAPSPPPAPWASGWLPLDSVPAVYQDVWARALNRRTCALIAPADLGAGAGAQPRAAQFSGGWAVAYDTPEQRSAFGVAGTGSEASAPRYDEWPSRLEWSDGSTAGYGPEGGSGPNQLAYLEIEGQGCLYNVWSRLGTGHLEHLLGQLRFVQPRPVP